jgi:hypothetical protein
MPAGEVDIYIEQGATWSLPLLWREPDPSTTPIDLTGYTARMHIRKKITDTEYSVELTTENGGITLGGAAGTILLLITAEESTTIAIKTGVYDLELIANDGTVTRLLQGAVEVNQEVTRE